MGKLRKIAFFSIIPIAIITIIECGLYYSALGLETSEMILCTLDNLIKIFLARSTISPYDAFKAINESYRGVDVAITYLYCIMAIIAPIMTTTAIVAGFKAYLFDFRNSLMFSLKPKMFVIGDGHMGITIAKKYARKFSVQYLLPRDIGNEARVPLLKEKIKAYTVDYSNMAVVCKDSRIVKADTVVLDFSDWFESYKAVMDLLEYLVRESDDTPTRVFIIDAPSTFRDVFDNTYKGLCRKHGRMEDVLAVTFINVNRINAERFFKNPKLTDTPDKKHHIIFTGIGNYGATMLRELFRYMYQNGLTGTIEVIDKDIDHNIGDLLYSQRSMKEDVEYEFPEPEKGSRMSVQTKCGDGLIKVNFYQANISELKFSYYMEDILDRDPVTEYFLCISDVSVSLDCYRALAVYGEKMENVKLYFRVGPDLESGFEAIRMNSDRLDYLPDSFPDIDLFRMEEDTAT